MIFRDDRPSSTAVALVTQWFLTLFSTRSYPMMRSFWQRWWQPQPRSTGRRSCRRPRTFRPQLEALEDRYLLATVMNLNDSGAGSLRAAINSGTPVDFQPGLSGTIALASTLTIN